MEFFPLDQNWLIEMISLWNKEIGNDFPLRQELFYQNSFSDVNVLQNGSFLAVNENGKLVGFIISKFWQEQNFDNFHPHTGWIQVLLVDSDYRNCGIGTELLTRAENALKESAVTKILIGSDPWHYFPGVPLEYKATITWLQNRGYEFNTVETDLYKIFSDGEDIHLPSIPDIQYTILAERDQNLFIDFLHENFPGRWEYEAIQYFKRNGVGREFVIAKKQGRIIGFCRINDAKSPFIAQNVYWSPLFSEELGGVGPLGIARSERKNGYGLAIVKAGIYFLRERGIKHMVIDWTGLVDFYGKLGFKPWKQYMRGVKNFPTEED
ncbi:GNAT family N-acetyltransferase [Bacillus kwashiorkori]|uniref:GNAT family N-acetyltransferase n=1 Tax=Bacillus kwashiorkori TaxID=1522318 RepID=UPI00078427AE|nr:GNAT family N-acetyltransferase [Bacillus kwashiorkori]